MPAKTRKNGVRVRVHRRNLEDRFTTLPNDLHRGAGPVYGGLTPHERVLLACGLSCKDGWGATLEDIEEWLPDLGRDRHEAVRRGLRERGFLTMAPDRIPAGEEGAGQFVWELSFYLDPLPEADRDLLRTKKARQPRKRAGQTEPGSAGIGATSGNVADDQPSPADETAGQTTPGSSGHGSSGHGEPGQGQPGSRQPGQGQRGPGQRLPYKDEKDHLEKDQQPLLPVDPLTEATLSPDETEAEPEFDEETRDQLNAALLSVLERRRGWSGSEVVQAMRTAITDGRHPEVVAAAVIAVANDPATRSPARLNTAGPWWNLGEPAVTGPVRYLDRAAPRCRTHPGEPATRCGRCAADTKGVPDDDQAGHRPALPRAEALAAIRDATGTAAARHRQRDRRRPDALRELTDAEAAAAVPAPAEAVS